ncbi:MAG: twin-arginine translocase subunit TatC [Capnocytophaga sp.]|nr:twin-arginine translocase subunit TatC [Capnocytophaga sp.]
MKQQKEETSFLYHLEVLRWHIIRSIIAITIIGILAFFLKNYIFKYIILSQTQGDFPTYEFFCKLGQFFGSESDFCQETLPLQIRNRTMTGQFSAAMWTSFWVGFIVGFPYLMYEMWRFISPGLYENERKIARGFIGVTSLLFFIGILFGYFIVSPLAIHFFATFSVVGGNQMIINMIDLESYIETLRSSVISCGVIFELPVIIYFLAKLDLISADFMKKYRRHAIVLTLLVAAIITPPDVSSQIIVSIPILLLYELSIYVCKYVQKNKLKEEIN